jgi:AcrR family transcriptional regulator
MPLSMTRINRDQKRTSRTAVRGPAKAQPRSHGAGVEQRILAAAERLVAERGAEALNVGDVTAAAGVARGELRAVFGNAQGLALALFGRLSAGLAQKLGEAYRSEPVWVDALRAALAALLAELESRPEIARFLIVGSLQGDGALLHRREQYLGEIARVIEADSPRSATGPLPPFGAEATLAAAASILHGRLLEDPLPALRELRGPLMAVIVMPFLDAVAAREELARPPAPAIRAPRRSVARQTVLHLGAALPCGMRLTRRTAQVLRVIATRPNSSNAAIAEIVGIGDQGQISRLLARLRDFGLIADRSPQSPPSAGKAWRITRAGEKLLADLQPTGR